MSRTALAFILFGLLAAVGVVGMLIQRARTAAARRRERRAPIPLVIPVTRGVQAPTPWRPPAAAPPVAATNGNGASNGAAAGFAPPTASDASRLATPDTPRYATAVPAQRVPMAAAPSHSHPAEEGTLQLLPGRFEVVAGMDGGRDIRFVRGPGSTPEITLGRIEGPMYRHVQLPAQTVSRMHARMRFEQGRWQIANLSPTNPLVVNGELLDADGVARVLSEGDRVELGEVVLRFRERA